MVDADEQTALLACHPDRLAVHAQKAAPARRELCRHLKRRLGAPPDLVDPCVKRETRHRSADAVSDEIAELLRGRTHEAELSARQGVEAAEGTDLLQEHAQALLALSEVLDVRGREVDSSAARREAIAKLEAKGSLAAVARLRGGGRLDGIGVLR